MRTPVDCGSCPAKSPVNNNIHWMWSFSDLPGPDHTLLLVPGVSSQDEHYYKTMHVMCFLPYAGGNILYLLYLSVHVSVYLPAWVLSDLL